VRSIEKAAKSASETVLTLLSRKNVVPGPHGLLGQIVEVHAKTRQVFRRGGHATARGESHFHRRQSTRARRVSPLREIMVHAKRTLVLNVVFGADIEVIAGIRRAPPSSSCSARGKYCSRKLSRRGLILPEGI